MPVPVPPNVFGPMAGPISTALLDQNYNYLATQLLANLTQLRATTPKTAALQVPVAFVAGGTAIGDGLIGSGNWYWFNASDTTSADNGYTIIVAADGGRWYLFLPQIGGNVMTPYALRNRIINGDMRIDQRNNGTAQNSLAASQVYLVDRWYYFSNQAGKFNSQQNAGSVTPPVGYSNYLGLTSTSAYTALAADTFLLDQNIEGLNIADLAFGTASARTVTLSFQVYSSLTGTFAGAIQNSAQNRSYVFTFSVSSINTWTPISVTIPGDTAGTWLTTNGIGIRVVFNLGGGTNSNGTAGIWQATGAYTVSGAVAIVGTNGATFYITGVQLERGNYATPFEVRDIQSELARCQRYLPAFNGAFEAITLAQSTIQSISVFHLRVTVRTAPTGITTSSFATLFITNGTGTSGNPTAVAFDSAGTDTIGLAWTTTAGTPTLTPGQAGKLVSTGGSGQILLTGCEL